jgi:Flp pilus assembly protein TadG
MNRRMGAESGQELVEYALVLPFFLLLVVSVIEFGLLFFEYSAVVNAAREGARAGITMSTTACNDACVSDRMKEAARTMLPETFEPGNLTVLPNYLTVSGIPHVRVTVRYRTQFMTPWLGEVMRAAGATSTVTLESTATMQREY